MTEQTKFEDPKIQLILSIIRHDDKITELLEARQWAEAAQSMCYLFLRFDVSDSKEDENMRNLRNALTINNYHQATRQELAYAYAVYHDFLNRTYYKGFSNNRPITKERSLKELQLTVDEAKYKER